MERETLMHKVMEADFACLDMHLFLNTHPYEKEAFAKFKEFSAQAALARGEYEKKHGPLSYISASQGDKFNWPDLPWPWQT